MGAIKALAPTLPTPYLRAFFAEKDIAGKTFEVEGDFGTNHIPNECVVERMAQMSKGEAKGVEGILRKIDFANGDVNHFLAHLAQSMAC
jgi:hypothetical protein